MRKGNLEPSLSTGCPEKLYISLICRREVIGKVKTINTVPVCDDHTAKSIRVGTQVLYVCNVCGRLSFRATRAGKRMWCNKHYKQVRKYGHAIDDSPRTLYDRNEIRIDGDVAYIDAYDVHGNVIATGIFDAEDVPKVQHIKWKLSASGYLRNTPKFKGGNIHFSRVILGTDQFVDHINHNTLDNRKANLRIVTKSQNQMNVDYKGVTAREGGKFYAYIKINGKVLNLGTYVFEEEALFARWYAETLLFKEYRYQKEKPAILPDREKQIREYVDRKVQRL